MRGGADANTGNICLPPEIGHERRQRGTAASSHKRKLEYCATVTVFLPITLREKLVRIGIGTSFGWSLSSSRGSRSSYDILDRPD